MSSSVCEGLLACLEPGLVEDTAMALRLISPKPHLFQKPEPHPPPASIALSSPNTTTEQQCHNKTTTDNKHSATFDSVFSLVQTSKQTNGIQPLRTTSLPTSLRKMSLELCTENLGCETGTDLTNASHFSSHSSCEPSKLQERVKLRRSSRQRKEKSSAFPPPLTSIYGQSSIRMRPHREGGRLVLKAVTMASTHACLQAERSDGRLLLRLVSRNSPAASAGGEEGEGKISENGTAPTAGETKEEDDKISENVTAPTAGETKEEEEEKEDYGGGGGGGEDIEVYSREWREEKDGWKTGGIEKEEKGEIGIGKYQRPGRCKEDGHGNKGVLLNWEAFWVLTS